MSYADPANADILSTQIPTHEHILTVDDVLPMALGFEVCVMSEHGHGDSDGMKCGMMDALITKNSKYPTSGSGVYCQKRPTSTTAALALYEGDHEETERCFFLTKLEISDVPLRAFDECKNINVTLAVDANGIASIEATTNERVYRKQLPIKSYDGRLNAEEVEEARK